MFTRSRSRAQTRWLAGIALALPLLASCDSTPAPAAPTGLQFPSGFLWGTATAGFQDDMGCPSAPCTDTGSDWYQWVTTPEIKTAGMVNGDALTDGPGQWELYENDLDLAATGLSNGALRLSIEWSRIFPKSTEGVAGHAGLLAIADGAAVAHYHAVFAAMKKRGLTPLVTLNHYTLPLWIHDGVACHDDPDGCKNRGWLDGDRLIPEIAKYAGFAAEEFGGDVDLWATENEPYAVALAGYFKPGTQVGDRSNPPGINDFTLKYGAIVIKNMIVAHARMFDAIHAGDLTDADGHGKAAEVGLVGNLVVVKPDDPSNPVDVKSVADANYIYNELFLNALVNGEWDEDLDGKADSVRDDLKGRMDYVGINYYQDLLVQGLGGGLSDAIPAFTFLPDFAKSGAYPKGLYDTTMMVTNLYHLPIIITENNSGSDDGFIGHLAWLHQAIAEGADVRGYFYWTLVDNFEWNSGYAFKLGFYSYDHTTKVRKAKPLAATYKSISESNSVSQALYDAHRSEGPP